jgi:hypothetical protein
MGCGRGLTGRNPEETVAIFLALAAALVVDAVLWVEILRFP